MDTPPGNIQDIYRSQGWNDPAAINADIAGGGWKSKVGSSGGGGGGGNAYSHILDNFSLNDIGGSTADFMSKNINPMEDKAFNDYLMAARSQQTPSQIYDTMENAAGIPQLRSTANSLSGQVNSLGDTINGIEGNVNANTTNSLVTEGQRSGMITAQKYPLQQILTPLSSKLSNLEQSINNQEQGINTRVGYSVQSNAQNLEPYKTNLTMMQDRAAQLISGFTADKSNQLQVLVAKFNAGQQMSRDEIQQAADLTKMEKQYELEAKNQMANTNNTANLGTQIVEVGGQKKLINSMTGAVIANLGSTNTGGGGGGGTNVLTPPASSSNNSLTAPSGQSGFDWGAYGLG